MKLWRRTIKAFSGAAFSLVEVVLALGVISFAIVAILGVFPIGLATGHSAQDETRAPQIAQTILAGFASQASTQFSNVQILGLTFDLTTSSTQVLYAGNDGQLLPTATGATYAVAIITNSAPPRFDSGYANQVTVSVMWPPAPNQGPTPAPNQTFRDFVRIVSRY